MPSDPTGRHPQGLLVRPAPDFFDDNIGSGAFSFNGSVPTLTQHFITVALFNNDSRGRTLKVYGVTTESDGGGGYGMYFVNGTVGAFYKNCASISPDLPMPPGQIYTQNNTVVSNTANPFNDGPYLNIIGGNGFDSQTTFSPFPMFIVSPGWSLVATNRTTGSILGFGFWYQVANE